MAKQVIDYTGEDFTRSGQRCDLILDAGGNRSLSRIRRALAPKGTLVLIAPGPGQWIGPIARLAGAVLTSRFRSQTILPFLAHVSKEDLLVLKELIEAGKVTRAIVATCGNGVAHLTLSRAWESGVPSSRCLGHRRSTPRWKPTMP